MRPGPRCTVLRMADRHVAEGRDGGGRAYLQTVVDTHGPEAAIEARRRDLRRLRLASVLPRTSSCWKPSREMGGYVRRRNSLGDQTQWRRQRGPCCPLSRMSVRSAKRREPAQLRMPAP